MAFQPSPLPLGLGRSITNPVMKFDHPPFNDNFYRANSTGKTYYVASTGSNTFPYANWATAATAPLTVTALMAAGDICYMKAETITVASSTTYQFSGTAANPCLFISTSDTTNSPPTSIATGAIIDSSATGTTQLAVNGYVYMYGVEFKSGNTGVSPILFGTTVGATIILEQCKATISSTSGTALIQIGVAPGTNFESYVKSINCTFTFGNQALQGFAAFCKWEDMGSTVNITTAVPTNLFSDNSLGSAGDVTFEGTDLSNINSTLVGLTTQRPSTFRFINCKLASGVAIMGAQPNASNSEAYVFDCNSGNIHYTFGHYSYWGNTTVSASVYHNSSVNGASYDVAGDKHSWVVTSVNGTLAHPYVSPWIDVYNEATSAVTPRLEILRQGVGVPFYTDEVWAEFGYKGTASSTRQTIVNNKYSLQTKRSYQATSALTTADWTGSGASSWCGVLNYTATLTPAVIGDMRARVCVTGLNTVYVNPKLLGI